MGQLIFAKAEYAGKKRKTRREVFLERMAASGAKKAVSVEQLPATLRGLRGDGRCS